VWRIAVSADTPRGRIIERRKTTLARGRASRHVGGTLVHASMAKPRRARTWQCLRFIDATTTWSGSARILAAAE